MSIDFKMSFRPVIFGLLTLMFAQCSMYDETQVRRERVRSDLKKVCGSVPIPEDFVKWDTHEVIKPYNGSYADLYRTESECSVAKQKIYGYWQTNKWEQTGPNSPYLSKDNYVVSSSCENGKAYDRPNTVRINCSWDVNGENKEILK